jgi:hypothetical protein
MRHSHRCIFQIRCYCRIIFGANKNIVIGKKEEIFYTDTVKRTKNLQNHLGLLIDQRLALLDLFASGY